MEWPAGSFLTVNPPCVHPTKGSHNPGMSWIVEEESRIRVQPGSRAHDIMEVSLLGLLQSSVQFHAHLRNVCVSVLGVQPTQLPQGNNDSFFQFLHVF